ncbi:3-hydroxy-3-methylglutaryl-coenzyme A reductase, partial [Variovorax sp. OK212]
MVQDSRLPNFRALTPAQRLDHVATVTGLTLEETALLKTPGALPLARANGMVENVIGTFELPLGVAGNFLVNGREYL